MPVTSQLLRGLSRTKVLASSLLPCQQHQSQLEPITHQPACRWLSGVWKSRQHSRSYQTSSALCSYILTPPQVNSILKANEYSFKVRVPFHEYKKEKEHISPTWPTSFTLTISVCCCCCCCRCLSLMERMCHR